MQLLPDRSGHTWSVPSVPSWIVSAISGREPVPALGVLVSVPSLLGRSSRYDPGEGIGSGENDSGAASESQTVVKFFDSNQERVLA